MIRVTFTPPGQIEEVAGEILQSVETQLPSRAYRGANELRNAAMLVLRGQGGGRRYRVPGTSRYYTASAPGSPPAVRTGAFRASWQSSSRTEGRTYVSEIKSNAMTDNGGYLLGELLENGTSKMAPRPHHDRIKEKALPDIMRIYNEPYV